MHLITSILYADRTVTNAILYWIKYHESAMAVLIAINLAACLIDMGREATR
jgi:hypothetical protein